MSTRPPLRLNTLLTGPGMRGTLLATAVGLLAALTLLTLVQLLQSLGRADATDTARALAQELGGYLVATLVLAFGGMLGLMRRIRRQIGAEPAQLVRVTRDIVSGNLQPEIGLPADDQTSALAHIRVMVQHLRTNQAKTEQQRWRDQGLALIHETSLNELTPRELARQVCHKLTGHLDVAACALYEFGFQVQEDSMVQRQTLKRLSSSTRGDFRFPEHLPASAALLKTLLVPGRLLRTRDIPPACLQEIEGSDTDPSHHYLMAPFQFENEVRGVLLFQSADPLPENVAELMLPGAAAIGVALESAQSRDNMFASLLDSHHLANQLQENQLQLQQSQSSLEEKIRYTNGIFDSMQSGLIVLDDEARIQDCNPALLGLTGQAREALIGRHCGEIFEHDEATLEAFMQDLSERLQGLSDTSPYEAEALLQTMPLGCIRIDSELRISMINPRTLAMLGHVREELLGRPLMQLIEGEATSQRLAQLLDRGAGQGSFGELALMRKDGEPQLLEVGLVRQLLHGRTQVLALLRSPSDLPWTVFCSSLLHRISRDEDDSLIARLMHRHKGSIPVRVTASFNAGRGGVAQQTVININDVSSLIHKNAQIQAQNRLLEKTMEAMQDGVLQIDRSGQVVTANPKSLELLGVRSAALVEGRALEELLGAREDAAFDLLRQWRPDHQESVARELFARDETRFLQRLAELPQPLVCADAEGCIAFVNASAARFLGHDRGDLLGQPLSPLLMEGDRERLWCLREASGPAEAGELGWLRSDGGVLPCRTHIEPLPLGKQPGFLIALGQAAEELKALAMVANQNVEWDLRVEGGTDIPVLLTAAPLRDAGGLITGAVVTVKDMRAIKEKEAENLEMVKKVEQSQRLDALGQLAAGVAHDFNNLLGVIQNHAELVEMKVGPESKAARNLSAILQATTRARDIVIKLNGLGRQQPQTEAAAAAVETFELAPVLDETQSLLQASLKGIEIVIAPEALSAASVHLRGDSGSLQQVLVNLCVNASHAIGERRDGRILVQASRPAEGRVQVDVVDNGSGIPPETLPRIFEPFFTTKEVGKGTGLGLAMVRSIVTKMGGTIDCKSTVGVGTTFSVVLPHV